MLLALWRFGINRTISFNLVKILVWFLILLKKVMIEVRRFSSLIHQKCAVLVSILGQEVTIISVLQASFRILLLGPLQGIVHPMRLEVVLAVVVLTISQLFWLVPLLKEPASLFLAPQ